MHPYDWIISGLALDLFGGLVLAKGFILKSAVDIWRESLAMAAGPNSAYIKSALHQKGEAAAGGSLLALGFLLQMWGAFHGAPQASDLGWINSWGRFALALAAALAVASASLRFAWLWARRRFLMIIFRGYTPDSGPIGEMHGSELDMFAKRFYARRRKQESDEAFRARLDQLRRRLGEQYGGREIEIR